jgi:hypothetical protein
MPDPDRDDRLAEIENEATGGVTGWMWAVLALSAGLALGIVALIDRRDPLPSAPNAVALRGSPAETTGAASHEPNEEVSRRWPSGIDERIEQR